MSKIYIYLVICVSIITFIAFAIDKLLSKKVNAVRIPESVLLSLCALGGSVGGLLGIYLLRHKSYFKRKFHFPIGCFICLAIQTGIFFCLMEIGQ